MLIPMPIMKGLAIGKSRRANCNEAAARPLFCWSIQRLAGVDEAPSQVFRPVIGFICRKPEALHLKPCMGRAHMVRLASSNV